MPITVDERRYLELAQYWIEARGHPRKDQPSYGAYNQDHKPVFEQTSIEGHAVRAALFYSAVTSLAGINGREDYGQAGVRLWENMTGKKMYLTGGIGATSAGEAFGSDYVLPNDGYLETCGAVAAGLFDRNLNLLTGDARYVDALELELYNGALTGVSLAGNSYTYVNPLQAANGNARWSWHGCPCCPPMFLKLMGAMPGYIYAQDPSGIYVNLFVGSRAQVQLPRGKVALKQTTDYPWNGNVRITLETSRAGEFDLHLRIPGWCQGAPSAEEVYHPHNRPVSGSAVVKVNGKAIEKFDVTRGYATLHRRWKSGDVVDLSLAMPVQSIKADPRVEADKGRVALMRGPVVYCFEGTDNGGAVQNLVIPPGTELRPEYRGSLLGGVTVLQGKATAVFKSPGNQVVAVPFEVTAIPYYANANRGTCQMQVWMPETQPHAKPQNQE